MTVFALTVAPPQAPPPVPTSAPSPVGARVARTSSSRRRDVERQLHADRHICRRPATPPSLPNLFRPTSLADILSCTPALPLIRPHALFDPSTRSRSSEPAGSPELGVARAPSTTSSALAADASPRPRRRTTGFVESIEDHWEHLLPDLTDCPHVGDDMAVLDTTRHERRYRLGLEPSALPLRDVSADVGERERADMVQLGAEESEALVRAASLPDAWGIELAGELAQREREARSAERRASRVGRVGRRAVGGASGSDVEGEGKGERRRGASGRSKGERARAHRASLQRETEAALQERLLRLDDILELDDPGSATDSGASSSTGPSGDSGDEDGSGGGGGGTRAPRPTLGYRALALRVQGEYRAKRRARKAEGRDLDESTDEEGG